MYFKPIFIIYLTTMAILASCGPSEKDALKNQQYAEDKLINAENNEQIADLNKKHSALTAWDSSSEFSYVLQEKLTSSNRNISFNGRIVDIVKVDSGYFLKIYHDFFDMKFIRNRVSSHSSEFLAFVEVSKMDIFLIEEALSGDKSKSGCFIIKVSSVVPLSHKVSTNVNMDVDECDYYFETDVESSLKVLKATLVDFYLNRELNNPYRRF